MGPPIHLHLKSTKVTEDSRSDKLCMTIGVYPDGFSDIHLMDYQVFWNINEDNNLEYRNVSTDGHDDGSGLFGACAYASERAIENGIDNLNKYSEYSISKSPQLPKPERSAILVDENGDEIAQI